MEAGSDDSKSARAEVEIVNKRGLHARASAKFVETVAKFSCDVSVTKDGTTVSGRSIMGLMMLGASQGAIIELAATGAEADAALAALLSLIGSKFHEDQ